MLKTPLPGIICHHFRDSLRKYRMQTSRDYTCNRNWSKLQGVQSIFLLWNKLCSPFQKIFWKVLYPRPQGKMFNKYIDRYIFLTTLTDKPSGPHALSPMLFKAFSTSACSNGFTLPSPLISLGFSPGLSTTLCQVF